MGNFFSLSQCCGCKTRPQSIFGKPKRKIRLHTVQPLIRIHTSGTSSLEQHRVTYSTTPPYFIGDNLVM
jgi:hypothetical protein